MYLSRLKNPGIRLRLATLYVIVTGITLTLFSVLMYQGFIQNHQREFDVALYNYTIDVARSIDLDLFGGVTLKANVLSQGEKVFPFALGNAYLQIQTLDGQTLARSRNLHNRDLPLDNPLLTSLPKSGFLIQTVELGHIVDPREPFIYRMISYSITKLGPTDFMLHIAVPMTLLEKEKKGLIFMFAAAVPILLLISMLAGLYLSRRALAPVDAIITKARRIHPGALSERVPVPTAEDEIRSLALTLNALLDRIQQSFESQEKFVADASHELKTPLAILRGEIDIMMTRARSPEELSDFLVSASQEVAYLSRIVEDLLVLARVDAGVASLQLAPLRLNELAVEAAGRAEKIGSTKQIKLRIQLADNMTDDNLPQGDPDLLRCLIFNLLDNAIKFSPSGSTVEIAVADFPGSVDLLVTDHGPGIPKEDLPHVFDRFYRSNKTRDRVAGSGLGLTLVKRIAEIHKADLQIVRSGDMGTQIKLTLFKSLQT